MVTTADHYSDGPDNEVIPGHAGFPASSSQNHASSNSDDLVSYINRLTRKKLLTAAEEKTLSRRVYEGDHAAKERLVEANMRLVVSIAKNYLDRKSVV